MAPLRAWPSCLHAIKSPRRCAKGTDPDVRALSSLFCLAAQGRVFSSVVETDAVSIPGIFTLDRM